MRTAALLMVALAAAACTAEAPAPGDPSTAPPAAPTSTPAPTPAPRAQPTREVPPALLTIAVAGDVHFEGPLRRLLDDPAAMTKAFTSLAAADLAIVNLETSVGTGGIPEPGKRFTFQAPPTAFDVLAATGVDVATMANNHALDFGRAPLAGTFRTIGRAPLHVVGLGRDVDEAFEPAVVDVDGTSVSTIGATMAGADPTADPTGQWAATATSAGTADALDPARLLRTVRAAGRTAEVVIVYLHWGVQGARCPSDLQRSLARRLVAAGADVVVGSHTHGLQGDGRLGRGYVAYGLGNYGWYTESVTGVLTLTVQPPATPEGRARVEDAAWEPARIGPDGLPEPLPEAARTGFAADLADLRACAGLGS